MSFFSRIAKFAVQKAPADLVAAEPPREKVDRHAEPPASERARRRPKKTRVLNPDREPVPGWVTRAVEGRPHSQDPSLGGASLPPMFPPDIIPALELVSGKLTTGGEIEPLAASDIPSPFKLNPWTTITDPASWLEGLRHDIAAGTLGARARTGALQEDLRFLALVLREGEPTEAELVEARSGETYG